MFWQSYKKGLIIYNEGKLTTMRIRIIMMKKKINLTMSSPISGVMLMLLLLILRVSDVDAPSDLKLLWNTK